MSLPRPIPAAAALLSGLLLWTLGGCAPQPRPPGVSGVCYQMLLHGKGKPPSFNVVSRNVPAMENCAANLEAMRIKFLSMGGNRQDINGAYEGMFIFINNEGIYASQTFDGAPYLALVRSGDGRLVVPGAMPAT